MFIKGGIVVAGVLFWVSSASANLIANGDFQAGDFSSWTQFSTTNGVLGAQGVVSFDTTGSGASLAARFDVGQSNWVLDIEEGGGISQVFLSGAGSISISADIGTFNASSSWTNAQGGVFNLLLDSMIVDTTSFGTTTSNSGQRDSLNYSGTIGAGSHEVSILITRHYTPAGYLNQYVDNVIVDAPAVASVPEPATLGLLSLGLAGLGFSRRKKF